MSYSGKFTPKNKEKYVGDHKNIVYRSLWERNTFRWLDGNPNVVQWTSEEIVIPYVCETDKKVHRYYVDIWFKTKENKNYLIEIKPKSQTKPPKNTTKSNNNNNNNKRKYIRESLTYIKNMSKWKAAKEFALDNDWEFHIWTEETLKSLGIKISQR